LDNIFTTDVLTIILIVACGIAVFFVYRAKEKAKLKKMRREFSANVSHELKTPLTTIYGYADMILNGMVKNDKDIAEFLAKIRKESSRMLELIDDIIRLSEWDEEVVRDEAEEFDLYTLGSEVVEVLTPKAEAKSVALSIVGGVTAITANKRMIYEVLLNLIDNAIKYNKPNGTVRVSLSQRDKTIIEVTDTGIGIPKEYHDRIFERFFRVDQSRAKQSGGTGLGLSIVKHIVQHYKGDISIESKENLGTKITVRI